MLKVERQRVNGFLRIANVPNHLTTKSMEPLKF